MSRGAVAGAKGGKKKGASFTIDCAMPRSPLNLTQTSPKALQNLDRPHSEGQYFSELIGSLDNFGAKYTVLYFSDPYNPIQYPVSHQMGRLLTESSGNASLNSTAFCDGVCQIKKTILGAAFVAVTLLIILIFGLCCMMGID